MKREYHCGDRDHTVTVFVWRERNQPDQVELNAWNWTAQDKFTQATIFLEKSREAAAIGRAALEGKCPPEVLADFIEDHPEAVRDEEKYRSHVRFICDRLRRVTGSVART